MRESVPFAVQTDAKNKLVDIIIEFPEVDHADVLNLSLGGAYGTTRDVLAATLSAITDVWGVPVFAAAGNDRMALSIVSEPGTGRHVVSVASSATRATTQAVSGYAMGAMENIEWYSSRGPSIDGAFKPDIAAPGMMWTSLPGWRDPGVNAAAGYQRSRGTSFATPMAAGGALLLLSAARQSHVTARPDQLRLALFSSARWLPAASAHAQGRGVMSVPAAWNLLRQNLQPVDFDVVVPVDNGFTRDFGLPSFGTTSLLLHEGWTAGQAGTQSVTVTRTTGPTGAVTYQLSLTGDDGTFGVPASVSLRKGSPTTIGVAIHPGASGVHAAVLDVDDPATLGVDLQIELLVVAAEPYTEANQFSSAHTGTVGNDDVADYFFTMPTDAVEWSTELATSSAGKLSWSVSDPYVQQEVQSLPAAPAGHEFTAVLTPSGGRVWEYAISTAFEGAAVPFQLLTHVNGKVVVSPSPLVIDPATAGTTYDGTLSLSTGGVAFNGSLHGGDLGPGQQSRASLDANFFFAQDVMVPTGSSRLVVSVDNIAGASDLVMVLSHCDNPQCQGPFAGFDADPAPAARIAIDDPQPGRWQVAVLPFDSREVRSTSTWRTSSRIRATARSWSTTPTPITRRKRNGRSLCT